MMSPSGRAVLLTLAATAIHVNAAPLDNLIRRAIAGLESYGISSQCQDTVMNLMSSPAADCLNIPGTVGILSTVANSSWIPPTNAWLSDFCAAAPCTDAALSATVQTVATSCASELVMFGIPADTAVQYALEYFPVAKQALCLRDSSLRGNDLCAVTTLNSFEARIREPLTPDSAQENYELLLVNDFAIARELSCTPCASAGFALARPLLPTEFLQMIDGFVGDQCGVDFLSPPTGTINVVTGSAALAAASATAVTNAADANRVSLWLGPVMGFVAYLAFAL